jgi:transporter family-2 protein
MPITLAMMMFAGAVLPLQFALNALLVRATGSSAIWAAMVSLLLSFTCMVGLVLLTRQAMPSWQLLKTVPLVYWFGGLGGAIFVATSTFALPRHGAATCVALALLGQLLMSAALDHFGLLGVPQKTVDLQRAAGLTLVVCGVLVLR